MHLRLFVAAAALLSASLAAHADLTGNVVSCSVSGGGSFYCNSPDAAVGSGTEFEIGNSNYPTFIGADFSATDLTLNFPDNGDLDYTILNLNGVCLYARQPSKS